MFSKPPKSKTLEWPWSRQFFFFRTHVKYSLCDPIIKSTNIRKAIVIRCIFNKLICLHGRVPGKLIYSELLDWFTAP